LVGQWREQTVPSLPGGLECGNEGLNVLGVLGTEGFQIKNWRVKEKVCAQLSKWKWLLPQLLYRGRVLVANNLVASTLWHRLITLTPPRGLIGRPESHRGLFLVWPAPLYLPVAEGGQGLINIRSKIASFRLQTTRRLLYGCGSSWLDTAGLLLRRVGWLDYDTAFSATTDRLGSYWINTFLQFCTAGMTGF